MMILDIIVRLVLFIVLIYGIITIIKDIKNGELKDFFGDDEEEERK